MMTRQDAKLIILGTLLALAAALPVAADPVSLFNGKDLRGWKSDAPEGFAYWTAKDGILQARSGPEKKECYLSTEKSYTDFVITLEFRYRSEIVDSGIMVRGRHDQIQIGRSGSLKRDLTGAPYIPGKGYPVEGKEAIAAVKKDGWNTLKFEARGHTYRTWVNGVKGVTYESETAEKRGPLALQIHGGIDMAIDFRNIKIEELK